MENNLNELKKQQTNLVNVSNNLSDYLKSQSDEISPLIIEKINEEPRLKNLWGLMPNKITKEHNAMTVERMRQIFKSKTDVFEYYSQTQLELVKIAGQIMIQKADVSGVAELTKHIEKETEELNLVIEKGNKSFFASRARQMADREQYKNDKEAYDTYNGILSSALKKRTESIDILTEQYLNAMKKRNDNG